ncbi:MAG: phosphotransferase family protein [Actinomycetota bacterium]|nr:phosphotransferase family protein [Actinomycetota bacterium]
MPTVGVDQHELTTWFANHVDEVGELDLTMVEGGHSCLTYLIRTVDGAAPAGGPRWVLRRPPLGHVLPTAHDVLREHRIITALAPTDVPVPSAVGACDDVDVIGAPFYVMDFVGGVVLHDRAASATLVPEARRAAGFSMVDVMVALHAVDIDEVGLGELARPRPYVERQLRRWHGQWEKSDLRDLTGMVDLRDWLTENMPEEAKPGIVHGDFRLGNAIHRPDGTVAALLDWELCSTGPAGADLSYLLRSWTDPARAAGRADEPAREVPSDLEGFPTRDELVERYEQGSGTTMDDLDYWMAFHAWRSACIAAGVYTRYRSGQMGEQSNDLDRLRQGVIDGLADGKRLAGIP